MSTGNEIAKGVSATDYEQQVQRLKRNLFDCQEAAKDIALQATKAEAERDALAANLKELEGQAERYRVLLSNIDHTQPMNSRMLAALRRIERWFGEFPPTGQQWDDGSPMSYFACYGSNGERDYMRSVARDAIAAAEAQQAELVDERVIDRTWDRFCGAFGDGPDAPYPGMIAAFETHYGQSFRDKEWRTEAACWAAAWSKATARADAKNDSYRLDALEAVAKASGTGVSFDWCRHVEDGMVVEHGYRMMWKHTIGPREKSIRHAIDAAMGEFKP